MKKLIIITHDFAKTKPEVTRFLLEHDITVQFLSFDWEIVHQEFHNGDILFFSYPQPYNNYELRYQIVKSLRSNQNLSIINGQSFIDLPIFNKLLQKEFFNKHSILTAKHWYFSSLNSLLGKLKTLSYPLVVKRINASRGKDMQIVTSQTALLDFFSDKKIVEFYFECFIESEVDIKVFVGKNNFYFPDIQQKNITLTKDIQMQLKKISQYIADQCLLDYSGIDFRIDNGQPYILEINRSPQLRMVPEFLNEFIKILH